MVQKLNNWFLADLQQSYATELDSHPKNRVYQGKLTYALNIEFEFTLNSM